MMEGSYRFKIGDIQCLAVKDGDFVGDAGTLFANAPEEALRQVLHDYRLQPDHIPATWTCLLVKTPTNVVLVDTGFGAAGTSGGRLLPALQAEGLQPEDIDTVILTHAHADHIGGAIDAGGQVTFPAARHHIWHEEWQFWTSEANLQKLPEWAASPARRILPPLAPHLETLDAEIDIIPGIRVVATPGHTAGHIAVEVESQGESLLYLADAALHPIQIEHPEWYARVDLNPAQTVATRKALYQQAVKKNALVLAFHFTPFPSLGHIVPKVDGWTWQPLDALP